MGKVLQFPVKNTVTDNDTDDVVAFDIKSCIICGKFHRFMAPWAEHERQAETYTRLFTCPNTNTMFQATITKEIV